MADHALQPILDAIRQTAARPFLGPVEQPAFLAVREIEVVAGAIATGSTNVSLSPRLAVATGHARQVDLLVVSDAAVDIHLRIYGAGRKLQIDLPATTLTANIAMSMQYTGPVGVEVEVMFTNASGVTAHIQAHLRAL